MAIVGYFGVVQDERLPEGSAGEVDISTDGPVLLGEQSAAERLAEDAMNALESGRLEGETVIGGLKRVCEGDLFYENVEDYDPVLLSHCRL